MPTTSYPNFQITSSAVVVLDPRHNGLVLTSTLGSSVNLQVTSVLPAGFFCWAVQLGAGAIGVTAASGATASSTNAATGTNGQNAALYVIGVTDGNAVFGGAVS